MKADGHNPCDFKYFLVLDYLWKFGTPSPPKNFGEGDFVEWR